MKVIIPYLEGSGRRELLKASLGSMRLGSRDELYIIEGGNSPKLDGSEGEFKYLFEKGPFNRGRLFNVAAHRIFEPGDLFMLADADLIYPKDYFEKAKRVTVPTIGWMEMHRWSRCQTERYLGTGQVEKGAVVLTPHQMGPAGGVLLIPGLTYRSVLGFPEEFPGWGGGDNAIWLKLIAFGYKFQKLASVLYHMYHDRSVSYNGSSKEIQRRAVWGEEEWLYHMGVSV